MKEIEIKITEDQHELVGKIAAVRGEPIAETVDLMFRHGASAFVGDLFINMATGLTEYDVAEEFQKAPVKA